MREHKCNCGKRAYTAFQGAFYCENCFRTFIDDTDLGPQINMSTQTNYIDMLPEMWEDLPKFTHEEAEKIDKFYREIRSRYTTRNPSVVKSKRNNHLEEQRRSSKNRYRTDS